MADISASTVMELRQRTGLGMMECKKALTEAGGDLSRAEELLRIKSGAKASKAAGRVAAEGVIGVSVADDAKTAAIVEVNCETDFVAKNEEFRAFANEIAKLVNRDRPADVAALSALTLASGETVEARRVALVQKIGENIALRRFARVEAKGRIASYVHGSRIGVLVDVTGADAVLGKDVAMHIAASKPMAVSREQVPADVVAKERSIAAARAAESGKPANIVEKMVEGAVAKFLSEVTLLAQVFVKSDKETVGDIAKARGATIHGFVLYVVGEGIERRKDDFAAEVAAMSRA
ncbi:MAG: elongation factor Ts [Betaproteobacteria bacterium]|nr:elongation factor Ts [Betaproteobacteria bacterium]MDE2002965.1 elongation factor Ts [Betaproteobacteria bacterium]MDE2360347.1 elongation factor Ts [Betaproteobacteria bacterium]